MPTLDLRPTMADEGESEEKELVEATEEVADETESEQEPEDAKDIEPEEEESEPAQEDESEAKVIEGLNAQKQALLNEIVNLRKERRQVRESKPEPEKPITVDDELKDLNPGDVEIIEKVLKAKGYVRKEDVNSLTASQAIRQEQDKWLQEHPEYLPENDPDDKNWLRLKEEVEGMYRPPSSPEHLRRILDRVHQSISPKASLPNISKSSVDAKKERIAAASKASTGSATPKKSSPSTVDKSLKGYLHGFSDDEVNELLG